jgi:hypothetical protein
MAAKPSRAQGPSPALWLTRLRARLNSETIHLTLREIGDRTATHPETVRRYLTNGTPSAMFLALFCRAFNLSAEWVLTGKGPRRKR